jgi:hypothetical protein
MDAWWLWIFVHKEVGTPFLLCVANPSGLHATLNFRILSICNTTQIQMKLTLWYSCKGYSKIRCRYLLHAAGLYEKLTGPQLVRKFSIFYGTRTFITIFTKALYLSLS